jgi:hypothetical protein
MNLFDAMHKGGAAGRHATREMEKIAGEVLEKAGMKLPVPAPVVCGSSLQSDVASEIFKLSRMQSMSLCLRIGR